MLRAMDEKCMTACKSITGELRLGSELNKPFRELEIMSEGEEE
jgi:hypothetical protein